MLEQAKAVQVSISTETRLAQTTVDTECCRAEVCRVGLRGSGVKHM